VSAVPWMDDAMSVAAEALAAARQGARVLVLRNTVRGCLEVQAALEEAARRAGAEALLFQCAGIAAPHHARYAKADRESLDGALEDAFGKEKESPRPVVLVATQTVQQSLDLDADLLLTDLAPLDVLLQRIGRLHRHARVRPSGFDRARVRILVPVERDLAARIGRSGKGTGTHGIGWIYDDLRMLEATWRQVERNAEWRIPSMNRALVEATTHPEVLEAIERESEAWQSHGTSVFGTMLGRRQVAMGNLVDWSVPYIKALFPGSDEHIHTRLGAGDRIATFAGLFSSAFGNPVSMLTIPAFLATDVPTEATPQLHDAQPERAVFTFGPHTFIYDRLGLRPGEKGD